MQVGKAIRMERLMNRDTKRSVIIPMDHGVSAGPISGLEDMRQAVEEVAEGGADAVLGHKGLVRCGHRKGGRDVGLILHLSSSTDLSPHSNAKTLTASVTDALKLGADGISMHVNLGDPAEANMLADLGKVASEAQDWGMPLLVMIYARGPKINDPFAPATVAHCARVAMELGADLVKVPYTGDMDSFARVIEGCCVPVLIAGGPKMETTGDFLRIVDDSIKAGGAGVSVGRNVFQHPEPRLLTSALAGIVHKGWSIDHALSVMEKE